MPHEKQATHHETLTNHYDRLVASGQISNDDAQRHVLGHLQALLPQLRDGAPPKLGLIGRLLGKTAPESAQSLYIWGNVGRGKSMLMNLFFDNAPLKQKKRVQFHAFMQDAHRRLHELRKQQGYKGDPVATLAKEIAASTRLLCFDELQATDVTDASVIQRIFTGLFAQGVVIVSTSNHPPASLYTGGVQRERFAKLIALIHEKMQVMALSSNSDYRMNQIRSLQKRYFTPLGADAEAFIENVLDHLTSDTTPTQDMLSVQGRNTPFTIYNQSIGRFSFAQLCAQNLGAGDYLALARRLDTVILTDIPALASEQRNEAKRFVTLIDALYEHKVKLIVTAAVPPESIYTDGDGSFEFHRTVSRLAEMQSDKYVQAKEL